MFTCLRRSSRRTLAFFSSSRSSSSSATRSLHSRPASRKKTHVVNNNLKKTRIKISYLSWHRSVDVRERPYLCATYRDHPVKKKIVNAKPQRKTQRHYVLATKCCHAGDLNELRRLERPLNEHRPTPIATDRVDSVNRAHLHRACPWPNV